MERTIEQQTLIDHFTADVDAGNVAMLVIRMVEIKMHDHDVHDLSMYGNLSDPRAMLMMLHDTAVGLMAQIKLDQMHDDVGGNGQIARDA